MMPLRDVAWEQIDIVTHRYTIISREMTAWKTYSTMLESALLASKWSVQYLKVFKGSSGHWYNLYC